LRELDLDQLTRTDPRSLIVSLESTHHVEEWEVRAAQGTKVGVLALGTARIGS